MEKANHSAAQRWWRTLPDDVTPAQAQARLDAWCAGQGDARRRVRDGERTTVGALMAGEPLAPLPAVPFPAVIEDTRMVSAQALVSWHGNSYSVPPGHGGQKVTVRHQLGGATLDVVTAAGTVLARHRRGRRPRRRGGPRRRSCRRAGEEGAGRPRAGGPAVPPQGAAPAVGGGAGRGRRDPRPGGEAAAPVTDFAAWAAAARPLRPGGARADDPRQPREAGNARSRRGIHHVRSPFPPSRQTSRRSASRSRSSATRPSSWPWSPSSSTPPAGVPASRSRRSWAARAPSPAPPRTG